MPNTTRSRPLEKSLKDAIALAVTATWRVSELVTATGWSDPSRDESAAPGSLSSEQSAEQDSLGMPAVTLIAAEVRGPCWQHGSDTATDAGARW